MGAPAPVHTNSQYFALLAPLAITTAVSATATTPKTFLGGARYLTAEAIFVYGSGGTNATAYIQTSLDAGSTWIDVISFQFTTSTASKVAAVCTYIAPASQAFAPTDGSLTANTIIQGVLGDRIRLKYVTTGTYGGTTTLAVYCHVKG